MLQVVYVSLLGHTLDNQFYVIGVYLGCLVASISGVLVRINYPNKVGRFIGFLYPLLLIGIFYTIAGYQVYMVLNESLDVYIINFENWLFGIHPTVWLEQFYNPLLNEWMLFAYSIYLLLIPFTTIWLYATKKNQEWRHMLGSLLISLFICYIIFSLIPVVGPRVAMADQYTLEIEGFIFRAFTLMLEGGAMLDGGAFPSAHCAAATVMLILAYRYAKHLFIIISPLLVTLILATVYGRYHYIVDVIAGIVIGIVGILLYQRLNRYWKLPKSIEKKKIIIKQPQEKEKITQLD